MKKTSQKSTACKTKTKPKSPKRRKPAKNKKSAAEVVCVQHAPGTPHWIPSDYRWNNFPPQVRDAVERIVTPAYRRFVLEAPGELERSVGLTLVHLTWLEICDQIQMALLSADPQSLDAVLGDFDGSLERHLRLASVKCSTAELLMKLRIVDHLAAGRPPPNSPAALPASVEAVPMLNAEYGKGL
jgi:hypothetical protein